MLHVISGCQEDSLCLSTLVRYWPNKTLWYAWLKWGQRMGSLDDASHCMCVLMCLTGNLEHAIKWVVLPSSSCFSGTQADAAIELHRQNNAALECVCVCEHVKQRQT